MLRVRTIILVALCALGVAGTKLVDGRAAAPSAAIPGWSAFPVCGRIAAPYPQYALAAAPGGGLWVACPQRRTLQRVSARGKVTATVRTGSVRAWSIAIAGGRVWAVERGPGVYGFTARGARLEPEDAGGEFAYVFAAAGSVWAADDTAKQLLRIDPRTGSVLARVPTGDGTSAVATDGRRLWALNHRDGTLDRIDLGTNAVTRLGRLPGDAPERMTLAYGSLWVTGRGTDLHRVDPETGAVLTTIDVLAGAIDLIAAGRSIWVAAPTAEHDRAGNPFVERLLKIDPATNRVVDVVRPRVRVVLDGLAHDGRNAWLVDVANGRLYRLDRP